MAAAGLKVFILICVVCHGVDAKADKAKQGARRRSSGSDSSRNSAFDWSKLMSMAEHVLEYAGHKFNSSFSMFDNFTHSSASTDTGLGEQLKQLWESNLQSRIIAPCERWCRANDLGKLTRHEYVAKAKNDQCNWNALVGAMSGAIPVPGLDAASSLAGGFLLQAQGACIVAKLRGYDVQDEKTQSLILWSLAGEAGSEIVKGATQLAAKSGGSAAGKRALKSVPNQFLRQVNKKVWPLIGRSLITKGPRGLMSLSKMIPVLGSAAGAVAGAAVDWFFCHRAIDFADQKVFLMLNKEEEDLRAYLLTNDFEDVVKPLMDARFDTQTICDAEKSDLQSLGLPLGRILKLRKKLFGPGGLCTDEHDEL